MTKCEQECSKMAHPNMPIAYEYPKDFPVCPGIGPYSGDRSSSSSTQSFKATCFCLPIIDRQKEEEGEVDLILLQLFHIKSHSKSSNYSVLAPFQFPVSAPTTTIIQTSATEE